MSYADSRKCSKCNAVYFRRNLVEAWTIRATGHRKGWYKEIAKLCMSCMTVAESRRVFGLLEVRIESAGKKLKVAA